MQLKLKKYMDQRSVWPTEGKHILAQYTDESVVVYQAYSPSIGHYAAKNQYFGESFSYSRMSWIKPNFLWMMYRCGWASKEGQEVVLAIHLKRTFFEKILMAAFPSSNTLNLSRTEWDIKVSQSNVRLQWDPDHNPFGGKEVRRAIQLGLRNDFLTPFGGDGINLIEDITEFVHEQNSFVENGDLGKLITPAEEVYPLNTAAMQNLAADYHGK